MLKYTDMMNLPKIDALDVVGDLLEPVPDIEIISVDKSVPESPDYRIDGRIRLIHNGIGYALIIEVTANGAPRFVRSRVHLLKSYIAHMAQLDRANDDQHLIPMIVSPYLSLDSRSICIDHDVAYLDHFRNAHLCFGNVYIDRSVAGKPKSETRVLRSIFKPKAAAILRVMLRDPDRAWRISGLAEQANASIGHASNVTKALLEREWAQKQANGIVLIQPGALLKTWRGNYRRPTGPCVSGYTHLHGKHLNERLAGKLNSHPRRPRAIYSRHSAAQWFAPFGRDGTHSFYADESGIRLLKETLDLIPAVKGANIVLQTPDDENLFSDAVEPGPGIFCTNPIITYLDLCNGNDRDQESAEHLAGECFAWLQP